MLDRGEKRPSLAPRNHLSHWRLDRWTESTQAARSNLLEGLALCATTSRSIRRHSPEKTPIKPSGPLEPVVVVQIYDLTCFGLIQTHGIPRVISADDPKAVKCGWLVPYHRYSLQRMRVSPPYLARRLGSAQAAVRSVPETVSRRSFLPCGNVLQISDVHVPRTGEAGIAVES